MLATRLLGHRQVQTVNLPRPRPGPGEVLIRVEAAGVCGTDRHLFHGEFPASLPVTLGHEFSGLVVENGPGADLPLGARVTCDPNNPCGACPECRSGRVNLCRNNRATGIARDGGFAEFAAFPAAAAHLLPSDLDPDHGAFCEPLACTLHGVDLGAPVPGQRVIVLGGGVIGMLALQLAHLARAEVMLVTRTPSKRALAESLGASATAPDATAALAHWPEGADLVLECAGVVETVALAPKLARRGGKVVVLGVLAAGQTVAIEPFDHLFREVQMLFSFINPFTQGRAAALIASGAIRVAPLISRRVSLADLPRIIAEPALPGEIRVLAIP